MATRTVTDHRYTAEHDAWLRANISSYRYKDLVRVFNEQFGTSLSYDAVTSHCLKELHIKRGKENQYGFAKGKQTSKHTLSIGAERWDGLVLWVKVADDLSFSSGTVSMISLMLQFRASHIFKSTSVVKFSPFPNLARDAVLMPLISRSCFFEISLSSRILHKGL